MNEYQKQYVATFLLVEIVLMLLQEFRAVLVCLPVFLVILILFHEQLFRGISLDNIKLFKKDSFSAHKRIERVIPLNTRISTNNKNKQKETDSQSSWYQTD